MAGSEQRPTDDVLGHGNKAPEDETAGDDRGKRNPDDVEGHMPLRRLDAGAVDEAQVGDDVEGHGVKFRPQDTLPGDDVAGHGARYTGQDTEAVDEDADDVQGHLGKIRLGQDTGAAAEDADDVAGHAAKVRLGQRIEAGDDVEGHGSRFNG